MLESKCSSRFASAICSGSAAGIVLLSDALCVESGGVTLRGLTATRASVFSK
ncbi:hypothetical protein OAF61_03575 [Pseudomonadales bacterium]|nr:hypothetical protein [bacterium]MDB4631543.1 hypothetical protein [Pseudomonadales bacterium]